MGYGRVKNSGLGSNWNMGDALSKPKGEWDDDIESLELSDEVNDEEIDDIEISIAISNKSPSYSKQSRVDFLSKKGTDPYSYNGLANTMQYLGAGYSRSGETLIEQYIREFIISETMSGRIAASNIGNAYKQNGTGAYAGRLASKDYGIDHGGYVKGTRTPKGLEPYVIPDMQVTKDGHQMTRHDKYVIDELEENDDDDLSSYEIMYLNIKKHEI